MGHESSCSCSTQGKTTQWPTRRTPGHLLHESISKVLCVVAHLDSDIKKTVQNCGTCQSVKTLPTAAPLHCWKWPASVWQRIHINSCMEDKQYFLVLTDSHLKWLEVVPMTTTTSVKTIDILWISIMRSNIFASHGLPEEAVFRQWTTIHFQWVQAVPEEQQYQTETSASIPSCIKRCNWEISTDS